MSNLSRFESTVQSAARGLLFLHLHSQLWIVETMSIIFSQPKRLARRMSPSLFGELSERTSRRRGSSVSENTSASTLSTSKKNDQGLTLMECIVAIAVIALTSAMIGPPLVLAAATRLQNRRAEQAVQIAQGEIDRVRTLVSISQHQRQVLPTVTNAADLEAVPAPANAIQLLQSIDNGCSTYTGTPLAVAQVLPIDIDGDCEEDFLMQVFRDEGDISTAEDNRGNNGRPSTFNMMVRVYAASARTNLGSNALETEPASLRFTSGQGNQQERPLAVIMSEMSWSDSDGSLFCYHGDCDD